MHTPLFLCLWALFSLLLPLKVEPCRAKVSPKTLSLLTSQPAAQPPTFPAFPFWVFHCSSIFGILLWYFICVFFRLYLFLPFPLSSATFWGCNWGNFPNGGKGGKENGTVSDM